MFWNNCFKQARPEYALIYTQSSQLKWTSLDDVGQFSARFNSSTDQFST